MIDVGAFLQMSRLEGLDLREDSCLRRGSLGASSSLIPRHCRCRWRVVGGTGNPRGELVDVFVFRIGDVFGSGRLDVPTDIIIQFLGPIRRGGPILAADSIAVGWRPGCSRRTTVSQGGQGSGVEPPPRSSEAWTQSPPMDGATLTLKARSGGLHSAMYHAGPVDNNKNRY